MNIQKQLLSYNDLLEKRDTQNLRLIVIHCTELPTLELAREFGERIHYEDGTGNSGHYYVDRDGSIYQYIEDDRVSRHVIGYNKDSLGIEIINTGRYPNWFNSDSQNPSEPYTREQIDSVKELLSHLKRKYLGIYDLVRHSDLDTQTMLAADDPTTTIRRKIDPGPMFPWEDVLSYWRTLNR